MSTPYLVTVNATNCIAEYDGVKRRMGFFATRHVVADNVEHAEALVVEALGELDELRQKLVNPADDPPVITLEDVVIVESRTGPAPDEALAWYAEDDDGH